MLGRENNKKKEENTKHHIISPLVGKLAQNTKNINANPCKQIPLI
jgi:hypothetical protein